MGREEMKQMGRLMAVGWPFLQIIAKSPWLLVLIFPFMSAITYDKYYKRDKYIPVVASGHIEVPLWGLDVSVKLRKTANGKGSILSFVAESKQQQKYSYALGIA